MDNLSTSNTTAVDRKLCIASIAGVYSPLILILTAALVLF